MNKGRWRFHFAPCWRYEKTEAMLSDMEARGFRVEDIRLGCLFRFRRANPKQVGYIAMGGHGRRTDAQIRDCEQYLQQYWEAEPLPMDAFMTTRYFRLPREGTILTAFLQTRQYHLRRILRSRLLLALGVPAFFGTLFCLAGEPIPGWSLAVCATAAGVAGYYGAGWMAVRTQS